MLTQEQIDAIAERARNDPGDDGYGALACMPALRQTSRVEPLMSDLSTIPTQDLLDEFMRRAERGETIAPISHWIAITVALNLVKEHARVTRTPRQKQWLLNRIVFALSVPEYEKWVAEYQQTIGHWDEGEEPTTLDRSQYLSVSELWQVLTQDERDAVLGAPASEDTTKALVGRGLLRPYPDGRGETGMCWTPEAITLRNHALTLTLRHGAKSGK
jgi:hypothetical protein